MNHLTTESRNTETMHLDEMSIQEALQTMNDEDQFVAKAIEPIIPELTKVIKEAISKFKKHGRLIYICRHKWSIRCFRCSRMRTYI